MAKKENNFYFESFIKSATYANDAAVALQNCFDNYSPDTLPTRIEEMHTIEHTADGVKHEMMQQLVKEFLPPIEREDIVELSHEVDDVTDNIEDVLLRLYMFNIPELREDAAAFTALISQCCVAMADMMAELQNFRKSKTLKEKIIEINRLEEEADKLYAAAMRKLYTDKVDAVTVIAWTAIYDRLEKCCDSIEDVADMVEQIVMKNS